jgi:iron complex outermembrane recepter protein
MKSHPTVDVASTQSPQRKRRSPRPVPAVLPLACSIVCSVLASAAMAQGAPAADTAETAAETDKATNALPTVTVTARKRKELLIDVPISMQALSEKELRASGITDVKDLGEQTGFSFSSAQGSGAQGRSFGVVTFRGLQGELNFPWENSGGIFVDGIFISGGVSGLGLGDVARVEVLKGPQNAFFGRSTFGGAVNFITKNPSDVLSGTVNATLSAKGSNDVDATIEGPLSDMVSARVSFGSKNKAALYHATDGGELGAETSKYISGTLYIKPSDSMWMRLRGQYQQDEDSAPAVGFIAAGSNTSCSGKTYSGNNAAGATVSYTPSVSYFCDGIPTYEAAGGSKIFDANTALAASAVPAMVNNSLNDPFLAKSPRLTHLGMARETKRLSAQAGFLLPHGMDLALNAGYNESNSTSMHDLDRTNTNNFLVLQTNPTRDLTLDTRLSTSQEAPLRGLIGASYFVSTFQLSQISALYAYNLPTPSVTTDAYLNLHSKVPALYASAEYDISPKWTATAEVRYQEDKTAFTAYKGGDTANTAKSWLPRLTLRFKPDAVTSAYVNLARGVQPLTVNGGYANSNAAGKAYLSNLYPGIGAFTPQPKLDSMEIGLKQQVNRWFQYAAAIYDQKWMNRLSGNTIFNPAACGTSTYNTPECPFSASGVSVTVPNEARIRGLELTMEAQISPAWSAGGSLDYKHAKWTRFDAANAAVLTGSAVAFPGNELGRVPKLQATANTSYRWALGDWATYSRADFTYVGPRWESDFNFSKDKGYNRVDLRQGFERQKVLFELFVRNVFDNRGWTSISRYPNTGLTPLLNYNQQGIQVTVQEPRTVGARMRYSF